MKKEFFDENLEKKNCLIYKGKNKQYDDNENELLNNTKIILSSLNSVADNFVLSIEKPFTVFIDEAAQTDVLTTFIPFLKNVVHLIIFDEHKQLRVLSLQIMEDNVISNIFFLKGE